MEALVILITGVILIIILKKMPEKKNVNIKPHKVVSKFFSRFKKHQNEKNQENETEIIEIKKLEKNQENETETLLNTAAELLKNGELKQAENIYIKVLNLDKKNIESYRGLGQICFKSKNYKNAMEIYQKLVELVPQESSNYSNLAMCYFKNNDMKKAADNYKKAIEIEKKPIYYKNAAITLYKKKDFNEAVKYVEFYLKKGDYDAKLTSTIINITSNIDDKRKAKKILKIISKKDPANKNIEKSLANIG